MKQGVSTGIIEQLVQNQHREAMGLPCGGQGSWLGLTFTMLSMYPTRVMGFGWKDKEIMQ